MDRPALIVEAPILDDDVAVELQDFLYAFISAFESHYYLQLRRHSDRSCFNERESVEVDLTEGEALF